MTDRELLEMAAKAAGFDVMQGVTGWCIRRDTMDSWNPLADDGDALRLAVKLEMVVDVINRVVAGYLSDICVDIDPEERESNPLAATRRAIVRAAAEIGKAMP